MAEFTNKFSGWYENHRSFDVTFRNGITTLVGKNGSGKTSMIYELQLILEESNIPVYLYNQKEIGEKAKTAAFYGDATTTGTYLCSSEGEQIIVSYGWMIQSLKKFLNDNKDSEMVFILMDRVDSGLSINSIRDIYGIFNLMVNDYPNLFIVNTTNNYEFIGDSRCIVAKTGKDIKFNNYDEYVKFIINQK